MPPLRACDPSRCGRYRSRQRTFGQAIDSRPYRIVPRRGCGRIRADRSRRRRRGAAMLRLSVVTCRRKRIAQHERQVIRRPNPDALVFSYGLPAPRRSTCGMFNSGRYGSVRRRRTLSAPRAHVLRCATSSRASNSDPNRNSAARPVIFPIEPSAQREILLRCRRRARHARAGYVRSCACRRPACTPSTVAPLSPRAGPTSLNTMRSGPPPAA